MDVIGHRGQILAAGPPENTLAAVEAAVAAGAEGVEVDVRVTADGVVVCVHDVDLLRVSGVALDVARATYDEIRAIRLPGGHAVARLAEVAAAVRGRAELVVDVKSGGRETVRTLRSARMLDATVVSSFCSEVLREVRREAPHARRALITGPDVPAIVALHRTLREGHAALHPHVQPTLADHAVVERAARSGVVVRPWTVNRGVDARLLAVAGAAAVFTDDVRALRGTREAVTSTH